MAAIQSVTRFLQSAHVPFVTVAHRPTFRAQEDAAVTHTAGSEWAKTVVCFADGEPLLAVVPPDRHVNVVRLRNLAGARALRLATEMELGDLYPECERGATPPLGPVFRQRVFVDESLAHASEIVFDGGTHTDAIRMRFRDFAAVSHPIVGGFADRNLL